MSEGYSAQILRVDLSRNQVTGEEVTPSTLRSYIGGYALGARHLYDEVPARAGWSDPRNRLMFLAGVLTGTPVPGSGGFTICTKGALTGGAAASQAQGVFGAYLRRCGFLGIILQGVSDRWVYLAIDENGEAQLRPAEQLVGKDTWQTVDAISADLGKGERQLSVAAIGPAGENLVRWAAVIVDKGHAAAHNGVGAVMGSKRLKAVAVARGRKPVRIVHAGVLKKVVQSFMAPVLADKGGIHEYGTLFAVHTHYESGTLPVRNYTTSIWDIPEAEYRKFSGPYMHEHFLPRRTRPCWACPNRHCQMMTITEGRYAGLQVEEPEYEQLSAFSANLGINEIGSAMMLGNTVDRLGLDTNEAGWICGCVMECFEKGILTSKDLDGLEVAWGDAEAARALLHRIARRKGVGDVLAEGVRRAVKRIGRGSEAIGIYTLKGGTPRSHDHRANWTELFDTCVSETGALENCLARVDLTQFGLPSKLHPFGPDEVARAEAKMKGAMQLEDSAVTCRFNTNMNVRLIAHAISAVTGWDFTFEEGMEVGRRAVHIMRAMNVRSGISADLDKPSPRYASAPRDGPARGECIQPHFERMLRLYYREMGWDDETGKPLLETLRSCGLEEIASELWGVGNERDPSSSNWKSCDKTSEPN